jgi:hypothetical protein
MYLSPLTLFLGKWHRLMMEEKGKNGKFLCKYHKVAAIIWGKEGM